MYTCAIAQPTTYNLQLDFEWCPRLFHRPQDDRSSSSGVGYIAKVFAEGLCHLTEFESEQRPLGSTLLRLFGPGLFKMMTPGQLAQDLGFGSSVVQRGLLGVADAGANREDLWRTLLYTANDGDRWAAAASGSWSTRFLRQQIIWFLLTTLWFAMFPAASLWRLQHAGRLAVGQCKYFQITCWLRFEAAAATSSLTDELFSTVNCFVFYQLCDAIVLHHLRVHSVPICLFRPLKRC